MSNYFEFNRHQEATPTQPMSPFLGYDQHTNNDSSLWIHEALPIISDTDNLLDYEYGLSDLCDISKIGQNDEGCEDYQTAGKGNYASPSVMQAVPYGTTVLEENQSPVHNRSRNGFHDGHVPPSPQGFEEKGENVQDDQSQDDEDEGYQESSSAKKRGPGRPRKNNPKKRPSRRQNQERERLSRMDHFSNVDPTEINCEYLQSLIDNNQVYRETLYLPVKEAEKYWGQEEQSLWKKITRIVQNRESAERSRLRSKDYTEELEQKIRDLEKVDAEKDAQLQNQAASLQALERWYAQFFEAVHYLHKNYSGNSDVIGTLDFIQHYINGNGNTGNQ